MNRDQETTDVSGRGPGPGRLQKVGDRWVGIWRDARGRRHRKTLSTDRRVAERAFAQIIRQRDLELAGLANEAGQDRFLAEIVEIYKADLATHRRPRYTKAVGYTLDALLAALGEGARIRDLTVPRLLLHRTKRLAAGVSNRTANADCNALRAALRWALASGHIAVNPLEHLRPLSESEDTQVKKRRALSDMEIGALLRAAIEEDAERARSFGTTGPLIDGWNRMTPIPQAPLWRFLVVVGVRYNEAATLRWADLDETEGVVTVRPEIAKSKRRRTVPVPGYLVEDLRALRHFQAFALGRMPGTGDRIFLSPKHKPLDPHGNPARILLTRILKQAGISYLDEEGRVAVDIHALRGSATTRLLRHGVPLATVATIMGHSDVRLTMKHYADLRIADTKKAVEGVPEIGAAAPKTGQKAQGS